MPPWKQHSRRRFGRAGFARGIRSLRFAVFAFVAACVTSLPAPFAACGLSAATCSFDAQCCARLVCGPARTCQSGCRIDRVFVRAGTRDPSNPCRVCDPGRSTTSYSPAANGGTCANGSACSLPGACRDGACVPGGPRDCADGDPCTEDACDPARGCLHAPVQCDDGNRCTLDRCDPAAGRCASSPDSSACDDGNDCSLDNCDAVAGCSHRPASGLCDDENACTIGDTCDSQVCVGGPPPVCEDENPCTADRCEPASGCVFDGGPLRSANEAGAFLVFPKIVASTPAEGASIETRVEVRNLSARSLVAHIAFINGDRLDPKYCAECDFDAPIRARQTLTFEIQRVGTLTRIRNTASGATRWCSYRVGFLTVDAEDPAHEVLTDNVLIGRQTVSNLTLGTNFSVPAIAVQGMRGDGNRAFEFDGEEYRKLPSELHAEFNAPDASGPASADLVVFTLGFRRQHPPLSDCSVIGEALPGGGQFSASFQFGCWASIPLQEIDPEFAYPDLGSERGRIRLRCVVAGEGGDAHGGVDGILVQSDGTFADSAAHLEPGPSAGCPVTLRLADPARTW